MDQSNSINVARKTRSGAVCPDSLSIVFVYRDLHWKSDFCLNVFDFYFDYHNEIKTEETGPVNIYIKLATYIVCRKLSYWWEFTDQATFVYEKKKNRFRHKIDYNCVVESWQLKSILFVFRRTETTKKKDTVWDSARFAHLGHRYFYISRQSLHNQKHGKFMWLSTLIFNWSSRALATLDWN